MHAVKLPQNTLIDPTTGTLYLDDDTAVDLLIDRLQASKALQFPEQAARPPIYASQEGFVTIRGRNYRFRGKQWQLLRILTHADGFRCSRADIMGAIYSDADLMMGLKNPEKSLRFLKDTVNAKLEPHRIHIDSNRADFWLVIQE